jgi:hypothetical protein
VEGSVLIGRDRDPDPLEAVASDARLARLLRRLIWLGLGASLVAALALLLWFLLGAEPPGAGVLGSASTHDAPHFSGQGPYRPGS